MTTTRSYVCRVCAGAIEMVGVGRPPAYCSPRCRYVANVERNGPLIRESARRWRAGHDTSEYAHRWRSEHQEEIREAHRTSARIRRAHRRAAGVYRVTEADWQALVRQHGGRCAYCGVVAPMEQDHVVPLSRGGRHAIGNLLPACGRCNRSKGPKLLVEWRAAA